MRYRMPVLAAGALAAAIAFGSSIETSAESLEKVYSFEVLDATASEVLLVADAPMALEGSEATVIFGENPFQGEPVAGTWLQNGPNLIQAPNMGQGWYTLVGPNLKPAKDFNDLPGE
jgi:hypothetical protein